MFPHLELIACLSQVLKANTKVLNFLAIQKRKVARITKAKPLLGGEDTFLHDKVVLFMMLPLLLKIAQLKRKSSVGLTLVLFRTREYILVSTNAESAIFLFYDMNKYS